MLGIRYNLTIVDYGNYGTFSESGETLMEVELAYGQTNRILDIPDKHLQSIVYAGKSPQKDMNTDLVQQALGFPKNSPTLTELVRQKAAKNAVIVVNDITRPTPYREMLPPMLNELIATGLSEEQITLLIATGIHRPQTDEESQRVFGAEICSKYRIINHNCDSDLASVGVLSTGRELSINKYAAQSDLLITTGLVGLHYFAGYSGGRKSILPGIASRSLIEANHKMMHDPRACLGNYQNNPVSDLMLEAAQIAGVDFILNVVTGSNHEIVYASAGHVYDAWIDAVRFAEELSVVPIAAGADIVIASCGGYPKDLNMYQAQKALDSAALAVKDGGAIILLAECSEGLGEDTFAEWMLAATCIEDVERRFFEHFELGGHKAYAICRTLHQADIFLYSSMTDSTVQQMFIEPVHDLQDLLFQLLVQYGPQASILVMPEAPKIAAKLGSGE